MSPELQPTRRLFFALWPDDTIRDELVRRRALLEVTGGRRVPDHNLHLTLLFLGDCPADTLPAIVEAAAAIKAESVALTLDRFGQFRHARVIWLGGDVPASGVALVDRLTVTMDVCGVQVDRRPWRPHVTLYRRCAPQAELLRPPPLVWRAQTFALVESVPGRPYRVLCTWPLGSAHRPILV